MSLITKRDRDCFMECSSDATQHQISFAGITAGKLTNQTNYQIRSGRALAWPQALDWAADWPCALAPLQTGGGHIIMQNSPQVWEFGTREAAINIATTPLLLNLWTWGSSADQMTWLCGLDLDWLRCLHNVISTEPLKGTSVLWPFARTTLWIWPTRT